MLLGEELDLLDDGAGLHPRDARHRIDLEDARHALEREDDAAGGGQGVSDHVGAGSADDHRHAAPVEQWDHALDLLLVLEQDDRTRLGEGRVRVEAVARRVDRAVEVVLCPDE
ncbi:MAG TPA: hypothetical protein VKB80_08860 [Kofleriaceae bacterium]|nr:hypothetical protein [Kofleriaceae bacterium]